MWEPPVPPVAPPFGATWATCDAPGCGRIGPLAAEPWRWDLAVQLPLGWRSQPAPTRSTPPYIYCPDHAFHYRGRTPTGQRCAPARRGGGYLLRRRVLRAYSADRRPCQCGAAAHALVADWGTRWRCPQPFGHIQPAGCPTCGDALHVGDDSARCPRCGYLSFTAYPEP